MLGVFKVDDYSWVCAPTEGQAKRFYMEEVGIDSEDFDEYYEGEVPLTDSMYLFEEDVPDYAIEMYKFPRLEKYGEVVYKVPFWYVILEADTQEPYIIASTEAM